MAWGNSSFAAPPIPRAGWTKGVLMHDRGFGDMDTISIGEASDEEWLPVKRRGALEISCADPVADAVICLHIKRLVSHKKSAERDRLCQDIEARLEDLYRAAGISKERFEAADRITAFCDLLAFDFSFESARVREIDLPLGGSQDEARVKIALDGRGRVSMAPWPFEPPLITGFILGYRASSYPSARDPEMVEFRVDNGA